MRMQTNELYQIAEKAQIQIDFFPLAHVKSISATDGQQSYIAIDPLEIRTVAEWNTHFAHELGHCVTGSFYNLYAPLDQREKHETTANKWAVHNLIPQPLLEQAFQNGYTQIWELAEQFDVTEDLVRKALFYYYETPPMR